MAKGQNYRKGLLKSYILVSWLLHISCIKDIPVVQESIFTRNNIQCPQFVKVYFISSKEKISQVHAKFHFVTEMWNKPAITEKPVARIRKKRHVESLRRVGRQHAVSRGFQEPFHLNEFTGGSVSALSLRGSFLETPRRSSV